MKKSEQQAEPEAPRALSGSIEAKVAQVAAGIKAASQARNAKLRRGLTDAEVKRAVALLQGGAGWEGVLRAFAAEVADVTLEAWKPDLLRRAQFPGGERRMPVEARE